MPCSCLKLKDIRPEYTRTPALNCTGPGALAGAGPVGSGKWVSRFFMSVQYLLALQTSGGPMGLLGFAPLIFIFAIFYFLLIIPQQRRQKKWQQMFVELKAGEKVVTSAGLRGTPRALTVQYI